MLVWIDGHIIIGGLAKVKKSTCDVIHVLLLKLISLLTSSVEHFPDVYVVVSCDSVTTNH